MILRPKPILLCVLLLAAVGSSPAAIAQTGAQTGDQTAAQTGNPATISVTAEGRVTAVPDMAQVSIGVAHRDASANGALDLMSLATAQVLERLQTAGIAPEDVQTGQLSLQPYYEQATPDTMPQQAGFEASTTLEVRVRDLAILGKVLDAVVADGATQLGGLRFEVADPAPLMDQARRAAVAEAQARADLYATAAGVTLGALQSLTEQGGFGGPVLMEARMMDASSSVPVAAGEVALTATVHMVWTVSE